MRKVIYLLMMCAGVLLTSCEKEEIGGTATKALAGEWVVTVDQVDEAGNLVHKDLFGVGHFLLNTFNTAANVPTEMWLDDNGGFWEFKVKVDTDCKALTFKTNTPQTDIINGCEVKLDGGKVLLNAATTPSGMPADSIVFYVSFDDDSYGSAYGYAKHRFSGYRYTGFAADE